MVTFLTSYVVARCRVQPETIKSGSNRFWGHYPVDIKLPCRRKLVAWLVIMQRMCQTLKIVPMETGTVSLGTSVAGLRPLCIIRACAGHRPRMPSIGTTVPANSTSISIDGHDSWVRADYESNKSKLQPEKRLRDAFVNWSGILLVLPTRTVRIRMLCLRRQCSQKCESG